MVFRLIPRCVAKIQSLPGIVVVFSLEPCPEVLTLARQLVGRSVTCSLPFVYAIFQTWFAVKVCPCIANLIMISYIKATNHN